MIGKRVVRTFVYFVFDCGSPDVKRIIDAADAAGCKCEASEGNGVETLHVEGDDEDIARICLMADYVANGPL